MGKLEKLSKNNGLFSRGPGCGGWGRLRRRIIILLFMFLTVMSMAPFLEAAKVVLHIRAGNPIEKPQKIKIKSELPARITTNDIISTDGLDVGYDMGTDRYYVHKEVELGSKQYVNSGCS